MEVNNCKTITTLFCLLAVINVFGQKPLPSLNISKASTEIKIDGELLEGAWKDCEIAQDFYQSVPVDTTYANTKTEVRVTYDEKYLYISAICYDTIQKPYIIQSLKRDFSYPVSDAFGVYIDPYDDHTNGFSFAVNPKGVQREGLIQVGGNYGVTTAWDILWLSEVRTYKDRWVVEMAIPFTSLRFNSGSKKWRINFSRNDLKRNEGSSWASVPRNFNIASLAFCGELIWDVPFESKKKSIAIIPYVTAGTQKTHQPTAEKRIFTKNLGTDARIGITNSLQLDLTLNPDFSQVEVDRQVTNLSRFSLFFPERRNFFIENSDLFSDFGFRQIRPFFSRTIGLDKGEIIPIVAGARLSGKVGKDWRIGVMNIHTNIAENRPMQNYSVLALQRRVLKNSTIGVIGLNRNSYRDGKMNTNDYNRIIGSDFNFNTLDRKWTGKVFYHHAFTPNQTKDNFTHASYLAYSTKNYLAMWNHEYVGENFIADFGFVPRLERFNPDLGVRQRNAYWRLEPMLRYIYYPQKKSWYIKQEYEIYMDRYADVNRELTDNLLRNKYLIQFKNTSTLAVEYNERFTKLYFNTDLTFTGDSNAITQAGNYRYSNGLIYFETNPRKAFAFEGATAYGEYYNGLRTNLNLAISYRYQPIGKFSLYTNQNLFKMPTLESTKYLSLIGAEIELSFTKSIFFTTFLQYNTQIDNFNINSRLQWRYKPMSDLYIVYSDNYLTTDFTVKSRGIVMKFTYWLQ